MSESELQSNLSAPDVDSLYGRLKPTLIPVNKYWVYGWPLVVAFVVLVTAFWALLDSLQCVSELPKDEKCVGASCMANYSLLFIFCTVAGAIGATVHAMTSFAVFAGKRKLAKEWIWWIYLRIPIGTLLSLLVFLAMVSGVISDGKFRTCQEVFLLFLTCGLAGLFSKQVAQKLSDLLNFIFGLRDAAKPDDDDKDEPEHQPASKPTAAPKPDADTPTAVSPGQSLGPDKTLQLIQEHLIRLGYLEALRADGRRFDDGEFGPVTRAAVEAFLQAEELVGEDREATLGDEGAPDYWTHLLALLDGVAKRHV